MPPICAKALKTSAQTTTPPAGGVGKIRDADYLD
jgi:hypothetical protein